MHLDVALINLHQNFEPSLLDPYVMSLCIVQQCSCQNVEGPLHVCICNSMLFCGIWDK